MGFKNKEKIKNFLKVLCKASSFNEKKITKKDFDKCTDKSSKISKDDFYNILRRSPTLRNFIIYEKEGIKINSKELYKIEQYYADSLELKALKNAIKKEEDDIIEKKAKLKHQFVELKKQRKVKYADKIKELEKEYHKISLKSSQILLRSRVELKSILLLEMRKHNIMNRKENEDRPRIHRKHQK